MSICQKVHQKHRKGNVWVVTIIIADGHLAGIYCNDRRLNSESVKAMVIIGALL